MKKDPTRIERTRGHKIKQISPAKMERLKTYFTRLGGTVTPPLDSAMGRVQYVRAPGQTTITLRIE
jgi:hypothetical protein